MFSHVRLFGPHGLYSPWNSPGQNTGVGRLSLLQGIFLTQGSNPGLLHCRYILYQLSHKGGPNESESCSVLSDPLQPGDPVLQARILEWIAFPPLQQIFRTQELNWGLRHCRQILYQLSYQGSPAAAAAAKSLQSCPSLCDPIDRPTRLLCP